MVNLNHKWELTLNSNRIANLPINDNLQPIVSSDNPQSLRQLTGNFCL